ncbi:choice-of-anchor P family protein [Actinosynnema sp. CS-041913]|uniref:choice-of-anchor P family protein n=1 Tax=Actinosynnema sp. CS-041913 TaxID=3239917 RepID=UPI003D8D2E20
MAVLTAALCVFAAPSAFAATTSSAFALSASGLLAIEPLAALDGSKGFRQTSVASVRLPDAKAPIVSVGVLNSEVDAGRARASVKDLKAQLGFLKLPGDFGSLTAETISASCVDGVGEATLAGAKIGTVGLEVQPGANTEVQVPGLLSVVLNKQTVAADGSLTVVAVSIEVAGVQKIDIASATCAKADEPETTAPPAPTTSSTPAEPATTSPAPAAPGKAPRPTPVDGHLAVTG